jgi:two-component system nitrate/nitrite response regulator NarL
MAGESAMAAQAVRVLVADNSRMHTQLMADALQRDPGLSVVEWNGPVSSLVPTVLAERVDVVAVSCAMDGQPLRGLDLVRDLLIERPTARTVVLLDAQNREIVVEAFRAGARGVFSREESVESFCKCIHRVHQGQIWANTKQVEFVIETLAASPNLRAMGGKGLKLLSKRENEVVRYLAQGLTNREIAQRMNLSQHTIKNYLFRVFDKLGVSSRVELLFMTLSQNDEEEEPSDRGSSKA